MRIPSILFLSLFMQIHSGVVAQMPFVFGQTTGMDVFPLNDTLNTYYGMNGQFVFSFGIHGSQLPDITVIARALVGGGFHTAEMKLLAAHGTSFAADTTGKDTLIVTVQDSLGNSTHDTTGSLSMIVTKYETGDSLRASARFTESLTYFAHSGYNAYYSPKYREDNWMNEWVGGTHYIAIRKMIDTLPYYGWIKVEIPTIYRIIIKEYAFQYLPDGIEERPMSAFLLYPNPVVGTLTFKHLSCTKIRIHDMQGRIVHSEDYASPLSSGEIDMNHMDMGMYIVRFYDGDKEVTRKIVKQ